MTGVNPKLNQKSIAKKTWAIASDWSTLITGKKSSKQVILRLTLHRLSSSKEISNILDKYWHAISFDIRLQNEYCARTLFNSSNIYNDLEDNNATHSSLDNNVFHTDAHTGHVQLITLTICYSSHN